MQDPTNASVENKFLTRKMTIYAILFIIFITIVTGNYLFRANNPTEASTEAQLESKKLDYVIDTNNNDEVEDLNSHTNETLQENEDFSTEDKTSTSSNRISEDSVEDVQETVEVAEPVSESESTNTEEGQSTKIESKQSSETLFSSTEASINSQKQISIQYEISKGVTLFQISKLFYNENNTEFLQLHNNITHPELDVKEGMQIVVPNPDKLAVYTVQDGDTLYQVARKFYSKSKLLNYIMEYNAILNPETDVKAGINIEIPTSTGIVVHTVQQAETLYSIMNTYYQLAYYVEQISKVNGNIESIKTGETLIIPNIFKQHQTAMIGNNPAVNTNYLIEINRSNNLLIAYKNGDEFFKTTVSTGENLSTPSGIFEIITKFVEPSYTAKNIPGGDPSNPLGSRWLGLSVPGTTGRTYGIHGTINPGSIGEYVTQGCIRMENEKIEWLFDRIPIGTKVKIV
ncbi:L,D-transpeptidase family protein [Bacillus sp. SM2101]|uniref:L,D-transpeptidase family protein n=1 Tax=Bacillus sp. SM2101 TaxID=2805366 RepID=UPI001BDF0A8A|nr:L,D-transpeptidase family protein [Bacillus sp. SM2101]